MNKEINTVLANLVHNVNELKKSTTKQIAYNFVSRIRNIVIHNKRDNLLLTTELVDKISELCKNTKMSYINFMYVLKEVKPDVFLPVYSPLLLDNNEREDIICPCCFRKVIVACADENKEYAYAPHFRHKEKFITDCLFSTYSSLELRKDVNPHKRKKGEVLEKSNVCDKERNINIVEVASQEVVETRLDALIKIDDFADVFLSTELTTKEKQSAIVLTDEYFSKLRIKNFCYFDRLHDEKYKRYFQSLDERIIKKKGITLFMNTKRDMGVTVILVLFKGRYFVFNMRREDTLLRESDAYKLYLIAEELKLDKSLTKEEFTKKLIERS